MKKLYIFIVLLVSISVFKTNAQEIPNSTAVPVFMESPGGPSIDLNNWVLDTALSDEFNETALDSTKWNYEDWCVGGVHAWGGNAGINWARKEDAELNDSGQLVFKLEKSRYIYPCSTNGQPFFRGSIESMVANYQYGYYEIYAKLPGFYDSFSGKPTALGLYPTFWMDSSVYNHPDTVSCCTSETCCPYYQTCILIQDEVDVLEPSGSQYANANENVYGVHDEYGSLDPCHERKVLQGIIQSSDPLYNAYHKFGLELQSDRIYFYFDDHPYGWQFLQPHGTIDTLTHALNLRPMHIFMGTSMDDGVYNYYDTICKCYPNRDTINAYSYSNSALGTTSPATSMYVDYFHYYKLNTANCAVDDTIYNNTQLNSFSFGLRNTITFDGTMNTDTLPTSNNTFRAVNEIDIKPGFVAPAGSILDFKITPCDH